MINTPFNYTGSKFKLLSQILPLMDYSKDYFIDVFAGGGSVYTNVLYDYKYIIANDIIKDLMLIQKELMLGNVKNFLNKVKKYCRQAHDKESYHQLRDNYNELGDPARLYALMLSCTNNMLRFNKKFKFNQTYGKRSWNKNTTKKLEEYLKHIKYMRGSNNIKFGCNIFQNITPNKNCMVYLDPPYINTEAGYNAFWSKDDESELYEYIHKINDLGASFMLSGTLKHDGVVSELLIKLIKDGFVKTVLEKDYNKVSRKGIKETTEIIIRNYHG